MFKELFKASGRESSYDEIDELRTRTIVFFLEKWGIVESAEKIETILKEKIHILKRSEKDEYDVVHKFRIMPTGAIRGKKVVIGNGVVVDPTVLLKEINALQTAGIDVDLLLSDRAHLITPYQIEIDGLQEEAKIFSSIYWQIR